MHVVKTSYTVNLVTQLPVDEQASGLADIVSDPADIDAEIFSVATEIVSGLLSDVDTISSPEVRHCRDDLV